MCIVVHSSICACIAAHSYGGRCIAVEDAGELLALSRQIVYDLWQDGLVSDEDMYALCFEDEEDGDDGEEDDDREFK